VQDQNNASRQAAFVGTISEYNIHHRTEFEIDFCVLLLNFLLSDTKAMTRTETLQIAYLDFFRNIDPLFEPHPGFDRRLRTQGLVEMRQPLFVGRRAF
jgi:hypothetical protein